MSFKVKYQITPYCKHLFYKKNYTGISAILERKTNFWNVYYEQKILSGRFMTSIDLEHLEYFYYWAKKHIDV